MTSHYTVILSTEFSYVYVLKVQVRQQKELSEKGNNVDCKVFGSCRAGIEGNLMFSWLSHSIFLCFVLILGFST
jgi:hypothetical protein